MHGLGFSLKALLVATATIALAIAGMLNASLWWASICLSYLFVMLTFSLLAVTFRRGPVRSFWIGFAIVGWTYAAMLYAPGLDRSVGHRLITTKILAKVRPLFGNTEIPAYPSAPPAEEMALNIAYDDLFHIEHSSIIPYRPPQWDPYQQAGHMFFGVWLAGLGGMVAGWMAADRLDSPARDID
jgi:hypothetical protein